jgi:hypothetical protein
MTVRTVAIAVLAALLCAGCAGQGGALRPVSRVQVPYDATREARDLTALSAGQLLTLDHRLRGCMARLGGAGGVPAAARFRECAFRELAHSSISQRLNAVLALTLTRRLHGGSCRDSLLAFAGVVRIVAAEAEGMLRELNSTLRWNERERMKVRALRKLARDTRDDLNPRAWRRDCRPAFNAPA